MDVWRVKMPAQFLWPRRKIPILILLIVVLLMVVSCVRRKDETVYLLGDEDVTLTGSATLLCSDQCRGSSQCGTCKKPPSHVPHGSCEPATVASRATFFATDSAYPFLWVRDKVVRECQPAVRIALNGLIEGVYGRF